MDEYLLELLMKSTETFCYIYMHSSHWAPLSVIHL